MSGQSAVQTLRQAGYRVRLVGVCSFEVHPLGRMTDAQRQWLYEHGSTLLDDLRGEPALVDCARCKHCVSHGDEGIECSGRDNPPVLIDGTHKVVCNNFEATA